MYSSIGRIRAVVFFLALGFSGVEARAQLDRFVRTEAEPVRLAAIRMTPAPCARVAELDSLATRVATMPSDEVGAPCDVPSVFTAPVIAPPVNPCNSSRLSNQGCVPLHDVVQEKLATLGKPGQKILRARDKILEILETENACTAWFHEKDANPAATFRTIGFTLDDKGQEYVLETPDNASREMLHFPYVAKVIPGEGAYSNVVINRNGGFFYPMVPVQKGRREPGGPGFLSQHALRVGSYWGDTLSAQVLALLHEFGHVIDRLPEDASDQGEQSAQNTNEVLRYCRAEIESSVKRGTLSARH